MGSKNLRRLQPERRRIQRKLHRLVERPQIVVVVVVVVIFRFHPIRSGLTKTTHGI